MTSRAASVAADHEALSDGYLSDSAMEDTKDKNKKKKAWKVRAESPDHLDLCAISELCWYLNMYTVSACSQQLLQDSDELITHQRYSQCRTN